MSLLLVDQEKQVVRTLSDDDSRLVRLLLLLPEEVRAEILISMYEKVADELTKTTATEGETEDEREIRIRGYLERKAESSFPLGHNDLVDVLIDTGRMDDVRKEGGLALVSSDANLADDVAGELCSAYEQLVDEDPGYARVEDIYSDKTARQMADDEFLSDMRAFILKWRRDFIEGLETDSAELNKNGNTSGAIK